MGNRNKSTVTVDVESFKSHGPRLSVITNHQEVYARLSRVSVGQVWRYSGPAAANTGIEWRIMCHDPILSREDRNSNMASVLLESLSPILSASSDAHASVWSRKGRVKVMLIHLVYDSYWSPRDPL